ncbi:MULTISPECIES: diacylglycerol kinase family protein [unclassified Streptomyces]|uniref:diacylglycerol kinase family protein n=1 Tax=unclassified Streptomyces TaxID=2593676 RepID=UPI0022529C16|nr:MULTISPECIES: diacylglycerol kinase family protein [unclassified Streptomyces]MCX4405613.1 diacylglycerol kinase family protein [Streptomyces sp. NBC_01764]MCX5189837.1 diacylglycerol kinase family protein [Streptomyces sp. NBC_00268]
MPTSVPERAAGATGQGPEAVRRSRSSVLPRGTGRTAVRIGVPTVCQAALLVGFGLLITGPAGNVWPLTVEDNVNEGFERIRTGPLTTLSYLGSEAGNTLTVIAITLLSCVALLLIPRLPMWRQAVFLAVAVSLQSLVFLAITKSVDRTRPDVHRLDASPPTSSYTSGHTGAATALYAGLAVLVLSRVRRPWRWPLAGLLFLVPLTVGVARLYRGMHHPTDVIGGMANGALSLLVVGRALFTDRSVAAAPSSPSGHTEATVGAKEREPGSTAVVFNPTVTGKADRERLLRILEQHGHRAPVFIETTAEDPGTGQAAGAVRDGATLVVVCGGDGTVRAAADALAGSGVPLVVVPCGTGNLLARNLGLPLTPATALDAALSGTPHRLGLGRIEGDGLASTHFAAMSGAGLDAAMLEHTDDRAKSAVGWPAYLLAIVGTLRTPRMRLTVRLDDAPVLHRTARMVLVANVGSVQGGLTLLPAARPDDGLLDLLILDPRGPGGWMRALGVLMRGRRQNARPTTVDTLVPEGTGTKGVPVEFLTFRRAELTFSAPQSRELDGDPVSHGRRLTAEVRPGALTVLLPTREK